jgi:hypothetical protein
LADAAFFAPVFVVLFAALLAADVLADPPFLAAPPVRAFAPPRALAPVRALDVVRAALAMSDRPLTVFASCNGQGPAQFHEGPLICSR